MLTQSQGRNDKCRCISPIQRHLKWCGEGDLNPHEIAPASTSSYSSDFTGHEFNDLAEVSAYDWVAYVTLVGTNSSQSGTGSSSKLLGPPRGSGDAV